MPIPKPHPPTVCNTMWALTDFTEENGATRIIPGSHLADHSPEYGAEFDSIPAEMPAGSVLVWHGSLWHGGGANRSTARRTGIAMNYCAGYIRQQENQQLGIPRRPGPGLRAPAAGAVRLRHLHGADRPHRQARPGRRRARPGCGCGGSGAAWSGTAPEPGRPRRHRRLAGPARRGGRDRRRRLRPRRATATRTARFPLASVTKLLTALAVLVAVEEGSVDLDQPAGPTGSTLRHLLAHASGLGIDGGVLSPPGAPAHLQQRRDRGGRRHRRGGHRASRSPPTSARPCSNRWAWRPRPSTAHRPTARPRPPATWVASPPSCSPPT